MATKESLSQIWATTICILLVLSLFRNTSSASSASMDWQVLKAGEKKQFILPDSGDGWVSFEVQGAEHEDAIERVDCVWLRSGGSGVGSCRRAGKKIAPKDGKLEFTLENTMNKDVNVKAYTSKPAGVIEVSKAKETAERKNTGVTWSPDELKEVDIAAQKVKIGDFITDVIKVLGNQPRTVGNVTLRQPEKVAMPKKLPYSEDRWDFPDGSHLAVAFGADRMFWPKTEYPTKAVSPIAEEKRKSIVQLQPPTREQVRAIAGSEGYKEFVSGVYGIYRWWYPGAFLFIYIDAASKVVKIDVRK